MREREREKKNWAGNPYLPIKSPDEKINTQETVWTEGGRKGEREVGRRKRI